MRKEPSIRRRNVWRPFIGWWVRRLVYIPLIVLVIVLPIYLNRGNAERARVTEIKLMILSIERMRGMGEEISAGSVLWGWRLNSMTDLEGGITLYSFTGTGEHALALFAICSADKRLYFSSGPHSKDPSAHWNEIKTDFVANENESPYFENYQYDPTHGIWSDGDVIMTFPRTAP